VWLVRHRAVTEPRVTGRDRVRAVRLSVHVVCGALESTGDRCAVVRTWCVCRRSRAVREERAGAVERTMPIFRGTGQKLALLSLACGKWVVEWHRARCARSSRALCAGE
jgi:hypothetical protein